MNRASVPFVATLLFMTGCAPQPSVDVETLNRELAELRAHVGPPPASLDQFYPPQAEAPLYRIKMHEVGGPLSGMVVDLMEGDMENVPGQFEAFRAAYQEVAAMVPEWQALWPMTPVDELGTALHGGDQGAVMGAVQGVGAVCHSCHVEYMPKVHQRYAWPSFADVRATDPVSGDEVPMAGYMRAMETSFSGMMSDLQQGQVDRAREHFRAFYDRFGGLADLCIECHDTEREYFIDEEVQRVVRAVGTAMEADPPDAARIGGLAQQIGEEACFRCHLVHTPAAFAQARWSAAH